MKLHQKRRRRTTLIRHQDCYLNCPFDWKWTTLKFSRTLNSSITRLTGLILKSFVLNVLNIWREINLSQTTMKVNCYILWRHLNRHKLSFHSRMQLARLESQLPSYIIHCLGVKKRLYRDLFNWYCLSWSIQAEEPPCKFWCRHQKILIRNIMICMLDFIPSLFLTLWSNSQNR